MSADSREEKDQIIGMANLYVDVSEEDIKKDILPAFEESFYKVDGRLYETAETEEISREDWLERMEELIGEDPGEKPLTKLIKEDELYDRTKEEISLLARYEIGMRREEDLIYFIPEDQDFEAPRFVHRKLVEKNRMFR